MFWESFDTLPIAVVFTVEAFGIKLIAQSKSLDFTMQSREIGFSGCWKVKPAWSSGLLFRLKKYTPMSPSIDTVIVRLTDILLVSIGFGGGAGAMVPEVAASARCMSGSRTVAGASRRSLTNSKYAGGSSPGSNGGNGL